ncbi:MAG: cobalt ECF transporter T component CbiQ [Coprobacillus sp.]
MNKLTNALLKIGIIEEWAKQDSLIHRLNPLLKMILTMIYILFVLSSHYSDILTLMAYAMILFVVIKMGRLSISAILKRSLIGLPISLCIGISNIIFMNEQVSVFGMVISSGYISLIALVLKNILCLSAVFNLIATTSFNHIACELVHIKVPSIFVMQLIMIYRYIFLLADEARQMMQAYLLKNPYKNSIEMKDFGSFIGSLLVRSFKRSEDVYMAMKCRGFDVHKTYHQYMTFELENYFLIMMMLGLMIMIKVVL